LRQTRGLGAAAAELAEAPTSLLALELTRQNFTGVLAMMSEIGRKLSRARIMILAERGLDDYEWLFREAGAVYFTSSPRELPGVANLVRRHFNRLPAPPAASVAAQVWDTLPWSDGAIA
jgi:hypothetical protein